MSCKYVALEFVQPGKPVGRGWRAALARAALALLASLGAASAWSASTGPVRVDAVEVELVSDVSAVVPGQPMRLGLRIRHDADWHTYWRNPGDSGLPTQLVFELPAGFRAGAIDWPAPRRVFIPPLANYGYEGEIVLPVPLQVPTSVPGDRVALSARASWLMCREVCIPGEAQVALELPVQRSGAAAASRFLPLFETAERLVARQQMAVRAFVDGDVLSIGLPDRPRSVEFFPYREGLLNNAGEQVLYASDGGDGVMARLALRLSADGARQAAQGGQALLAAAEGIVRIDGQVRELVSSISAGPFVAGDEISRVAGAPPAASITTRSGLDLPGLSGARSAAAENALPGGAAPWGGASGATSGALAPVAPASLAGNLWMAALLGAIGGLILNLMPCVFPVIGLKVLGFARHGSEGSAASRISALAFAAGVVISFWALAGLLLALRAAGEAAGWGFQLQSPVFVAAMALLFVAIALNFSGVYEFGSAMSRLGQLDARAARHAAHPLFGSFASGVLAVLVATPCTAPFMGSALGYTLGSTTSEALVVFTAIGVGMAAPYLLLGLFPGWLRWLPRPGRWMETFRQLLAFPMYATAAWLAWVLGRQAGIDAAFALAIGAVLLGLAAWLFGRFVQAGKPGRRAWVASLALLAMASGLATAWPGRDAGRAADAPMAQADPLAWQAWSPAGVSEAIANGQPVFVEFTAAWCVSCQVNKRLVLERETIVAAMAARGVRRLQADWTRRDPLITAELARYGRNGVPLYLFYRPGESQPEILPELLTSAIVNDALSRVAVVAPGRLANR